MGQSFLIQSPHLQIQTMNIRPHRLDDLMFLKQIMAQVFEGVSLDQAMEQKFGLISDHDWKWRKTQHLDVDVNRKYSEIFVAEVEGKITGFITTWQDKNSGIGHIPNIGIVPEFQGRGLGRKLILHALNYFRHSGLTHAKIETLIQNDVGNHLYTSVGFREIARQIHFVGDLDKMEYS